MGARDYQTRTWGRGITEPGHGGAGVMPRIQGENMEVPYKTTALILQESLTFLAIVACNSLSAFTVVLPGFLVQRTYSLHGAGRATTADIEPLRYKSK